jgi:hypothetical protein
MELEELTLNLFIADDWLLTMGYPLKDHGAVALRGSMKGRNDYGV